MGCVPAVQQRPVARQVGTDPLLSRLDTSWGLAPVAHELAYNAEPAHDLNSSDLHAIVGKRCSRDVECARGLCHNVHVVASFAESCETMSQKDLGC